MDKESLGDHQASIFILESRAYELPSLPTIPKMRYENGRGVASLPSEASLQLKDSIVAGQWRFLASRG